MGEYCINLSRYREGDTLVVSKCEVCGGVGTVRNKWFERCAQEHGESQRGQCGGCEWYHDCYLGEIVECEACNGSGKALRADESTAVGGIDERTWLKKMVREYRTLLERKYGEDNFSFVIITMAHEGEGIVTGFKAGYTSDALKKVVELCKDLLARTFALEKIMHKRGE